MVKGKEEICVLQLAKFNSVQGVGQFPLYSRARYAALAEIINHEIPNEYQHFLAQPIEEDDKITWYATPFIENPIRYVDLPEHLVGEYSEIKEATIAIYQKLRDDLNNKGDDQRFEYIDKALKFICNDFIYCYDNKVVLAVWGMKPKENIHESTGEYITDVFQPKKEKQYVTVTFDAGDNGTIDGSQFKSIDILKGTLFDQNLIPLITETTGYNFNGWSNPEILNGERTVDEIITVKASYLESEMNPLPEEPLAPQKFRVTFTSYIDGQEQEEIISEFDEGHTILAAEIPYKDDKKSNEFNGWDADPEGVKVNEDLHFRADYTTKSPWWKKWWNWIMANGCLTWLLRALIVALIIALILYFWRSCESEKFTTNELENDKIDNPIVDDFQEIDTYRNEELWLIDESDTNQQAGVYIQNPETQLPTNPRVIIPFNEDEVITSEDGFRKVVSGRLNGLITKEKSIYEFAKKFKNDFPSDEYQIIYFDTLLNRIQFSFPESKRSVFKSTLNRKYRDYDLFLWDESLFETGKVNDPAYQNKNKRWHLDAINAEQVWGKNMGDNKVIVAIVDNGFDLNHEEFKGKIVRPYNVLTKSSKVTKSTDNHGTHVAGIAIANSNDKGLLGVAPLCSFMPIQVSHENNPVSITAVLDGILYAIYQGADVINVSIALSFAEGAGAISVSEQQQLIANYYKEEERMWSKVFQIAEAKKTVIVVAAGNDNILAGIDPIHRNNSVITVSAVDKDNRGVFKSSFSNFGKFTTISAPGVQIYSALNENNYGIMDGTSMATPIVTGAVALLKSHNRLLTPKEIKEMLVNSAQPIDNKIGPLLNLGKLIPSNKDVDTCCIECDAIQKKVDSLNRILQQKKQNCP